MADSLKDTIDKSINFIVRNLGNVENPFKLAIVAYALQLAAHPLRSVFGTEPEPNPEPGFFCRTEPEPEPKNPRTRTEPEPISENRNRTQRTRVLLDSK